MVNRIALYGKWIALLGGADVDILCRLTEDDLRAHVREILCACMPGGGYALGTGNSMANYVPVRNYLAMLDEGAAQQNHQHLARRERVFPSRGRGARQHDGHGPSPLPHGYVVLEGGRPGRRNASCHSTAWTGALYEVGAGRYVFSVEKER